MKLIGITGHSKEKQQHLNDAYIKAFTREGFLPVIIPTFDFSNREVLSPSDTNRYKEMAEAFTGKLDALILSGGADLNPLIFGDENYDSHSTNIARDYTESFLTNAFLAAKKPIMGICRGFQLLGNIFGMPNFYQDLAHTGEIHSGAALESEIRNEPIHVVTLKDNLLKHYRNGYLDNSKDAITVNSFHHQGFTFKHDMKQIKPEKADDFIKTILEKSKLKVLAFTPAVIEAFEHSELPVFATQWHPEEYGPEGITIGYFLKNFVR